MRGKIRVLAFGAVLALTMAGCGPRVPVRDIWGNPWDESWTMVGDVIGVEETPGLTLQESMDVLAANGLYYGSFVAGESQTVIYQDEEGKEQEEAEVYEAQVYLLVGEGRNEEAAKSDLEEWLDGARRDYSLTSEGVWEIGGEVYQILEYDLGEEAAPLAHGISAFASLKQYAVCAELTYQESYGEDVEEVLREFLGHCHYAEFE